MKPYNIFVLIALLLTISCAEFEPNSVKIKELEQPIIQNYSPSSGSKSNARLQFRIPNGLVVRTSSGDLKLFPFINTTFYGHGGGGIVGTGYNYNKYLPADWNNDGKTDLVARSSNSSLDYARFKNGQFTFQIPPTVGTGFGLPILTIGEWATPYGGEVDTPDLLAIDYGGNITIYPFKDQYNNNSSATFQNGSSFSAGSIPTNNTHYFVADWSGDGLSDIISRDVNGNMFYYIFSSSSNTFVFQNMVGHGWFFTHYFIVDTDRDGIADELLVRNDLGELKRYFFRNGTFYGNNSGLVVGTGFNYTHYFVNNWVPERGGAPQIIGRDTNGNMYFHSYIYERGNSRYSGPTLVGHGWNFTDYFMGTW
jgi:hypothetical protein